MDTAMSYEIILILHPFSKIIVIGSSLFINVEMQVLVLDSLQGIGSTSRSIT